jgi:uncharacterized protein (DUF58 family)
MISPKTSRWFLIVMAAVGIVLWAATGNALFLRLAYLATAVLAAAGLLSIFLKRGIEFKRNTRHMRGSVGDIFEERFEVGINSLVGCPWLEVVNQSTLPGATGSKLLTNIKRQEKRLFIGRTALTRRGAFPLGPTVISAGDPFGLFPIEMQVPANQTLIVLPMTYPLENFPPPPGLLPGGKTIRVKTQDVTPHAAGVREYSPGDPMKRIHWRSTARRNQIMVKEFEQDPQAEIWVFIDGKRDLHVQKAEENSTKVEERLFKGRSEVKLPCDTFEYALSTAGSLAKYYLHNRKSVGLVCSSARTTILASERGERQLGKILETLAFLQPDGAIPLQSVVSLQAKLLPLGSGVILITPSTSPGMLVAVEDLQHRNLRPIIIFIKADTFGGEKRDQEAWLRSMTAMNVPVIRVGYGDDLRRLSLPGYNAQRSYFPRTFVR